jgi:hypothetical protein
VDSRRTSLPDHFHRRRTCRRRGGGCPSHQGPNKGSDRFQPFSPCLLTPSLISGHLLAFLPSGAERDPDASGNFGKMTHGRTTFVSGVTKGRMSCHRPGSADSGHFHRAFLSPPPRLHFCPLIPLPSGAEPHPDKSGDSENLSTELDNTGHRHGSADSGHLRRAFSPQVAFRTFTSITKWGGT